MKGILFARVSTKEQAEEGYSLPAQVSLLEEYGRKQKEEIKIVKNFEISESARGVQERALFTEMLEYLKNNPEVKCLLCEKVDRLSRNFIDATKLGEWLDENENRRIHFVKQSLVMHKNSKSHEKFQWDIYLALARQYSNNLSEESQKGLNRKAFEGGYPGSRKRGYKTIGVEGKKMWIIDKDIGSEAPYLIRAFEFYDTGEYTLKTLSKKMFKEGWKTQDGKPIGKTSIHKLLSDCFYCGEFVWKKQHYHEDNVEGGIKHEPLISRELFKRVQARLKRKLVGKYRTHNFLFKGLISCGECDCTITGQIQKEHIYYRCTLHKSNCTQRSCTREEELEEQVISFLSNLEVKNKKIIEWIRKALKESHSAESEYHEKSLKKLDNEYVRIEKRLDTMYEDKLDGKITQDIYDRKFEQYNQHLNDALQAKKAHKNAKISYFELGANIFELSQRASQLYRGKHTSEEKRKLLGIVFSNLSLKDGKLIPNYTPAFEILANRSKTNSWLGRRDSNPRMSEPKSDALPLGDAPQTNTAAFMILGTLF